MIVSLLLIFLITLQTSAYSNDSSENIEDSKENFPNKKLTFITSTTPLEPDKKTPWKSIEDLKAKKEKSKDIDKEFDMFSKERITTKRIPVPLEPNIVVLVPKGNLDCKERNLGTLKEDEEKHDEINTIISETASSITEFCHTNFLKTELCIREDDSLQNISDTKDTSSIKDDTSIQENDLCIKENSSCVQNNNIKASEVKRQNSSDPINIAESENNKERRNDANNEDILDKKREDSPAPLNFDEISRKPKKVRLFMVKTFVMKNLTILSA